ncbi:hypothetical protein [Lewinella sp. JB7]|uniref:hypothetical protein n=1 Tax=Lewinella sp. JB7 TaxID=2962887 RepID=UPI0020CA198D|nr:hypothetical protein [Lewinella sp. JB7]MCP9237340.1 hypothetical protein [Lewinella sp. JB7]
MHTSAHPTGNLVVLGEHIYWSYIDPIDDPDHLACIMTWTEGAPPRIMLRSEFPASDYLLAPHNDELYIIERRFVHTDETFYCRILKMKAGESPTVLWDWFADEWRIGEGGFFMASDRQIVFARYPGVYTLEKGGTPVPYPFIVPQPIRKLWRLAREQTLLLSANACWLVDAEGTVLEHWSGLVDPTVSDATLNRNDTFDVDYRDGVLLLAYWGKRTFEVIFPDGRRRTLAEMKAPDVPHWVAYRRESMLLFSSRLVFDGSPPRPRLVLRTPDDERIEVWRE